jgi:hypothetical protein
MEDLSKALFGGKLLQGAFPHTQEEAYIHKTDEETEQPHTPVGNKERPDAYRRDFNDPDEESPKTEDREEAGADEESPEEATEEARAETPEESPETPETPASPVDDEEQTIEATPEPETPVTEPELDDSTPEQTAARERGRQAVADAMARLDGRDGHDEGGEEDVADAEAADAMGEPGEGGEETPATMTPAEATPAEDEAGADDVADAAAQSFGRPVGGEQVGASSAISVSVPLLLRLLEWAREEDAPIHQVAENLMQLASSGPLGMKHYDEIMQGAS